MIAGQVHALVPHTIRVALKATGIRLLLFVSIAAAFTQYTQIRFICRTISISMPRKNFYENKRTLVSLHTPIEMARRWQLDIHLLYYGTLYRENRINLIPATRTNAAVHRTPHSKFAMPYTYIYTYMVFHPLLRRLSRVMGRKMTEPHR